MKYSVIIPVYKAQKTIQRCIDSLINQPHEEVEFIIVNDGSPDESGIICQKYAEKYPCIRYYETENRGVSSARNLGLTKAKGEYVLFVDSDDYVSRDYFERINAYLEKNHPDMLLFGMKYCGKKSYIWNTGNYIVNGKLDVARKTEEAVKEYLLSNLMSKTFCRAIIEKKQLRFDESLDIGEDQDFVFRYMMHVEKMVSTRETLYFLMGENSESLSRKRRDYLPEQLLKVSINMLEALNAVVCSKEVKRIHYNSITWSHYRSAYSSCKELLKYPYTGTERKRYIKRICESYTLEEVKPKNIKTWIIAFPIIHKMCWLIDILSIQKFKKRQKL